MQVLRDCRKAYLLLPVPSHLADHLNQHGKHGDQQIDQECAALLCGQSVSPDPQPPKVQYHDQYQYRNKQSGNTDGKVDYDCSVIHVVPSVNKPFTGCRSEESDFLISSGISGFTRKPQA